MTTINSVGNSLSGTTGSGSHVGSNSPTLVTPTLGAALATSINFGGSSLSSYVQAGTFTPALSASTPPSSITYSTQVGSYNKIGSVVNFSANIVVSALTIGSGSGTLILTGLPFTSTSNDAFFPVSLRVDDVTFSNQLIALVGNNTTNINFQEVSSGNTISNLQLSGLSSSSQVYVSGIYFTNS